MVPLDTSGGREYTARFLDVGLPREFDDELRRSAGRFLNLHGAFGYGKSARNTLFQDVGEVRLHLSHVLLLLRRELRSVHFEREPHAAPYVKPVLEGPLGVQEARKGSQTEDDEEKEKSIGTQSRSTPR